MTRALIDSGANGFVFIDTQCAVDIARFLSLKTRRLPRTVPVKGYNGREGQPITHYLRLHLTVDRRRQYNLPLLILDLGSHDMILGRKWLAYFNILVDARGSRLVWPKELQPSYSAIKEIKVLRTSLRPGAAWRSHQDDADARDQAMALEDQSLATLIPLPPKAGVGNDELRKDVQDQARLSEGLAIAKGSLKEGAPLKKPRVQPRRSQLIDSKESLRKMEAILKNRWRPEAYIEDLHPCPAPAGTGRAKARSCDIGISTIGAFAYRLDTQNPENEAFLTSFYEIDRILEDRYQGKATNSGAEQVNAFQEAARNYTSEPAPPELRMPERYRDYEDVASKEASNVLPPHRIYDHRIDLTQSNNLGYSPLYKMTTAELEETKRYLLDNLHKGFIEPSQAPFAAPILFVKKADGSLRLCVDYRKLNELTRKDRYPLPLIDELLAQISKAKIYTKLDVRQAFHRIRMDPDAEELTTFRTRYGSYKYKVLPFGLTNGPATYQRYMNDVLFDYLDDFCTAYLDDILIYSDNELEHEIHVKKVLQRLRDAGLQVDLKKCEFHVTRTKYLGFIITTEGIEVDPEKVSAVTSWKAPYTVKGVQSFLGFCNFYRRFIKDYSRIAKPLIQLTKTDVPFEFGKACWDAFEELKARLTAAPLLRHYRPEYECMIETDASDGVIAGVFSQLHPDSIWYPVAYFSKSMAPAEYNYEIHDKEMLAIVRSLEQWRPELQSTHNRIQIYTDHRALEYFMTTKRLTARQARWAEALSEYYFQIMYRSGKSNVKADALTRRYDEVAAQNQAKEAARTHAFLSKEQVDPQALQDLNIASIEEDYTELAPIQESVVLTDRLLKANREAPSLNALRAQAKNSEGDFTLEEGLLLYNDRLVVPLGDENLATELIKEAHTQVSTAHPGRDKTYHLLRPRYYWKNMLSDIERYIRNCNVCRRCHAPRDKTPGMLHPLPVPQRPWQHITMDFKSAPKDKHGFDNIYVVIDRLSKQAVSIPCHKEVTAEGMARLFIRYIYSYFGPPDSIVSDRGPQFISRFWKEFCRILGVDIRLSTADHPQTDGQTEIMNEYNDHRLRPFVSYYQDDWSDLLPLMDYAQLTLPHSSLGMLSPFEVLYGYAPRTSFDWKDPQPRASDMEALSHRTANDLAQRMSQAVEHARQSIKKAQAVKERVVNAHRRPVDWKVGDKVWVSTKPWATERPSKKLDQQMAGPYKVLEQVGYSWRVKLPDSIKVHNVFPSDRLRKASEDPLPGQVEEPPPPIHVTGDAEYEVEEILASKILRRRLYYRVHWSGHDLDPTWYLASNFKYAPHKLQAFHDKYPLAAGPPQRLPAWIAAYNAGRDEYEDLNSDVV